MIDVGLTTGVKTLWQNAALQDYTLKVEDLELRVHKVILAAVSNFFQAMLCDSYVESNTDSVELKGLSADAVSKLVEFVYTGDEYLLSETGDALEVLKCAMYLQMPTISNFCVKKLSENLTHKNCLEILAVCTEFSFHKESEVVKNFIKLNWKKVFDCSKPEEMSATEVEALIENWQKSEWDMFLFIKDWFNRDPENYKDDVNNLMTQVRFCTIPPRQVDSIREMDIFCNTQGSWHELVEKAMEYHQLPMHMRVLEKSKQAKLRAGPSPVTFSFSDSEDKITFWALDEENHWRKHEIKGTNAPKSDYECIGIGVNAFLVVASYDKNQVLLLFDPRTLTWSLLPKLPKPTMFFTLVHHEEHLYAIGGENIEPGQDWYGYGMTITTDVIEQYSFRSNTWTSFCKLPIMMRSHPAACMLGDKMYISGARKEQTGNSGVLYCLDLSSEGHEWEEKAPGEWLGFGAQLCVVKIVDEEFLLMIHECLTISCYSPSQDEWTQLKSRYEPPFGIEEMSIRDSFKVIHGNSLFILNVSIDEDIYDSDADEEDEAYYYPTKRIIESLCWKWTIPAGETSDVKIEDFPFEECFRGGQGFFGCCSGLLALPCEMFY